MKKIYSLALAFFTLSLLSGCAGSYHVLQPSKMAFTKATETPDITLEYHYNALTEANNKKYYKKEIKHGLQLVMLKITNNSQADLEYNKNYQLYTGANVLSILPTPTVYTQLKQQVPLYLLYMLLTSVNLYTTSATTGGTLQKSDTKTYPIGLILGPGITAINMITASSANTKFKADLETNNIFNKVIKKGESAFVVVGINSTSFQPISIKAIESK